MRNFADGAGIGDCFLDEGNISGKNVIDTLEKVIGHPRTMGEQQKRNKDLTKFYIDNFLSKNI